MASTNSPSVIWVAGESAGKTGNGAPASPPSDITPAGMASTAYVDNAVSGRAPKAYADNIFASGIVTHDKLVASGILPTY